MSSPISFSPPVKDLRILQPLKPSHSPRQRGLKSPPQCTQGLSFEDARHRADDGGGNGKQSERPGVGGVIHDTATNRRPHPASPTASGENIQGYTKVLTICYVKRRGDKM